MSQVMTLTPKDYKSEVKPTWCPGCGDFGVLNAIYNSMAGMKLAPDQTVVVSGIGCSSRLPHFVQTFGFHSLHGRALPVAQGLKMARPDLTVVAVDGLFHSDTRFLSRFILTVGATAPSLLSSGVSQDNALFRANLTNRPHDEVHSLRPAGLTVQPHRHRAFTQRQLCSAWFLIQAQRTGRARRTGH